MAREYLIRLPWPPTATSPNARGQGNWRKKSEAAKGYKETCAKTCWEQAVKPCGAESASVTITYHPPSLRRIDWDNMANRCKQGFDAVAEAVGIDDGGWWPVVSQRGEKVKGGCVLVHVKPGQDQAAKMAGIPLKGCIS